MNLQNLENIYAPIRHDNKDRSVSDPKKELVQCGSHFNFLTCACVQAFCAKSLIIQDACITVFLYGLTYKYSYISATVSVTCVRKYWSSTVGADVHILNTIDYCTLKLLHTSVVYRNITWFAFLILGTMFAQNILSWNISKIDQELVYYNMRKYPNVNVW